jgi:hypothetical protein
MAVRFAQNLTNNIIPFNYNNLRNEAGFEGLLHPCHNSVVKTIRDLCINTQNQIEIGELTH